jgi:glutaredoxin
MVSIYIFGMEGCPDCEYQKKLMNDKLPQYPYDFIDIESDDLDDVILLSTHAIETIPTIVIDKNGVIFKHEGKLASHKILDVIEG